MSEEAKKQIEVESGSDPLPLNMAMELKVFAIAAIKKDLWEREGMSLVKDKLTIAMMVAYTESDAYFGAVNGIRGLGMDPDTYVIPGAIVSRSVRDILEKTKDAGMFLAGPAVQEKPVEVKMVEETKAQSIDRMVASVRMIFDHAGTAGERLASERVIKKFLQANAKTGN